MSWWIRGRGAWAVGWLVLVACGNTGRHPGEHAGSAGEATHGDGAYDEPPVVGGAGGGGGAGGESTESEPSSAGAGGDHSEDAEPDDEDVEPERLCEPGALVCDNHALYECNDDGSELELRQACDSWQACDVSVGYCRSLWCTPNELGCRGTQLVRCDAEGRDQNFVAECASKAQTCIDGACSAPVCVPGHASCFGSRVMTCNEHGTQELLSGDCSGYGLEWHCALDADNTGGAHCSDVWCTANEKVCDGANRLRTCDAQGLDYLPEAVFCGNDAWCRDGECKPKVCKGLLDCLGNTIINCQDFGLAYTVFYECPATTQCVSANGDADCVDL